MGKFSGFSNERKATTQLGAKTQGVKLFEFAGINLTEEQYKELGIKRELKEPYIFTSKELKYKKDYNSEEQLTSYVNGIKLDFLLKSSVIEDKSKNEEDKISLTTAKGKEFFNFTFDLCKETYRAAKQELKYITETGDVINAVILTDEEVKERVTELGKYSNYVRLESKNLDKESLTEKQFEEQAKFLDENNVYKRIKNNLENPLYCYVEERDLKFKECLIGEDILIKFLKTILDVKTKKVEKTFTQYQAYKDKNTGELVRKEKESKKYFPLKSTFKFNQEDYQQIFKNNFVSNAELNYESFVDPIVNYLNEQGEQEIRYMLGVVYLNTAGYETLFESYPRKDSLKIAHETVRRYKVEDEEKTMVDSNWEKYESFYFIPFDKSNVKDLKTAIKAYKKYWKEMVEGGSNIENYTKVEKDVESSIKEWKAKLIFRWIRIIMNYKIEELNNSIIYRETDIDEERYLHLKNKGQKTLEEEENNELEEEENNETESNKADLPF